MAAIRWHLSPNGSGRRTAPSARAGQFPSPITPCVPAKAGTQSWAPAFAGAHKCGESSKLHTYPYPGHHNPLIGSVPHQTPDKRAKSANAVLPISDPLHRQPCRDRRLINARIPLPQRCAAFLNFLNFAPRTIRTSPTATSPSPPVVILNFLNFAARSVTQRWTLLAIRSFSTARKNRRSGPSGAW